MNHVQTVGTRIIDIRKRNCDMHYTSVCKRNIKCSAQQHSQFFDGASQCQRSIVLPSCHCTNVAKLMRDFCLCGPTKRRRKEKALQSDPQNYSSIRKHVAGLSLLHLISCSFLYLTPCICFLILIYFFLPSFLPSFLYTACWEFSKHTATKKVCVNTGSRMLHP
jgi:hypothetical protein